MQKFFFTILAAACLTHSAFAQTLAEIGGIPITQEQVVAADPTAANDSVVRNKVLLALIDRQAVLNEAKRTGIEQTPTYKLALTRAREEIAINLSVRDFTDTHPVSSQEITAAYNRVFNVPMPEEYRYREIVVPSFTAAQSAIISIKSGKNFSIVAADTSQDQSAIIGGEVGWQPAPRIPMIILKTLQVMQIEQVAGPVSIPEGYIVVQLLGKRSTPKPTLDQVRSQITTAIQQQNWVNSVVKLRTAQGARLIVPLSGR